MYPRLTAKARMTLNLLPSCLYNAHARITSLHHYAQFVQCWGSNPEHVLYARHILFELHLLPYMNHLNTCNRFQRLGTTLADLLCQAT